MTPSAKCVSLITAQRLLAVGFPQETERYWHKQEGKKEWEICLDNYAFGERDNRIFIAAPDAQELGEKLGVWLMRLDITAVTDIGLHFRLNDEMGRALYVNDAVNEAEARAACYIYLKEQGLI